MSNPPFAEYIPEIPELWLFRQCEAMRANRYLKQYLAGKLLFWSGRVFDLQQLQSQLPEDFEVPDILDDCALLIAGSQIPSIIVQSCWKKDYKQKFKEMQLWLKQKPAGAVQMVILFNWNIVMEEESVFQDPVPVLHCSIETYASENSDDADDPDEVDYSLISRQDLSTRDDPPTKISLKVTLGRLYSGKPPGLPGLAHWLDIRSLWLDAAFLFSQEAARPPYPDPLSEALLTPPVSPRLAQETTDIQHSHTSDPPTESPISPTGPAQESSDREPAPVPSPPASAADSRPSTPIPALTPIPLPEPGLLITIPQSPVLPPQIESPNPAPVLSQPASAVDSRPSTPTPAPTLNLSPEPDLLITTPQSPALPPQVENPEPAPVPSPVNSVEARPSTPALTLEPVLEPNPPLSIPQSPVLSPHIESPELPPVLSPPASASDSRPPTPTPAPTPAPNLHPLPEPDPSITTPQSPALPPQVESPEPAPVLSPPVSDSGSRSPTPAFILDPLPEPDPPITTPQSPAPPAQVESPEPAPVPSPPVQPVPDDRPSPPLQRVPRTWAKVVGGAATTSGTGEADSVTQSKEEPCEAPQQLNEPAPPNGNCLSEEAWPTLGPPKNLVPNPTTRGPIGSTGKRKGKKRSPLKETTGVGTPQM